MKRRTLPVAAGAGAALLALPASAMADSLDAANNGVRKENWGYALKGILAAKSFTGLSPETKSTLDFWHGWTIYHQAMIAEKPQNLASAKATLPLFEQSKALFTSGRPAAAKKRASRKAKACHSGSARQMARARWRLPCSRPLRIRLC